MGKHYKDPKLKIFSLSSNRPLAEKIAEAVGLELGKISISRFSDGEVKVNVEESIRGAHVYIVQLDGTLDYDWRFTPGKCQDY